MSDKQSTEMLSDQGIHPLIGGLINEANINGDDSPFSAVQKLSAVLAARNPAAPDTSQSASQAVHPDYTVHSCSYFCELPACIKQQRDELRDKVATAEANQWRPIADAMEGVLVVCCWVDKDDGDMRHNFDYLEDGVWQNYFNEHEHFLIAGAASGRSEDAPYTYFMPLPLPPTGTGGNHGS